KLDEEVVELVTLLAGDLESVPEAACREKRCPRAPSLDDRVRDECRAVDDQLDVSQFGPEGRERIEKDGLDSLGRIVRRRERLSDRDRFVPIYEAEVGERPAYVDAGAEHLHGSAGLRWIKQVEQALRLVRRGRTEDWQL